MNKNKIYKGRGIIDCKNYEAKRISDGRTIYGKLFSIEQCATGDRCTLECWEEDNSTERYEVDCDTLKCIDDDIIENLTNKHSLTLKDAYIWIDFAIDYFKNDACPDDAIKSLELCKKMIMEKYTGCADEDVIF